MLSPKTIEIIKSTVPVLEVHGTAITKRFYEMLFTNHPELLNIFNHANQKQGRQQNALAGAVYAAAANIDNLAAIIPVVKQIGHKHRSLGILPEHYPIVGETLLAAIKDVLGDAATDEIINAWAEAYGVISGAFIGIEQGMYEEAAVQAGGWTGFRNFVVDKKVQESDVITSFYLKPQDGQAIASYLPGQYLSLKLENIPGEKNTHIRQYSLSDAPGKGYYRISVKREGGTETIPAGVVTNYLHDEVQEGDVLPISAPAGDFTLDTSKDIPLVLLSGGVGLTPMLSMLNTVVTAQPGRNVTFIHAAINSDVHALRGEVEQVAANNDAVTAYFVYEKPTDEDRAENHFHKEGYIDHAWLQSVVGKESDFYFCGPLPFMKAINRGLKQWGVTGDNIHFEFFGPATELEDPATEEVK
jgi:nitric oxide dioxygenase